MSSGCTARWAWAVKVDVKRGDERNMSVVWRLRSGAKARKKGGRKGTSSPDNARDVKVLCVDYSLYRYRDDEDLSGMLRMSDWCGRGWRVLCVWIGNMASCASDVALCGMCLGYERGSQRR